ncbi:MAG TPA: hypothetical protein VF656_08070 [Pyrinomonadaceae bacterium]
MKSNAGARATGARLDGGDVPKARAHAIEERPDDVSQVGAPQSAVHFDPLVLQTNFEAGDRTQFHVAELLNYHDRYFVEGVYRAVLRRAPSASELARELDDLRGGRAGKTEIIERLLSAPESRAAAAAGRGVSIEGLPSPLMRRLARVPWLGYAIRLARALVRLPVSLEHQRQFEIYALARQQLIADYVNEKLALLSTANAPGGASVSPGASSQQEELVEAVQMFSDALLELSDSHAELQAHTQALQRQTQTQAEQAQSALSELTEAITAQQQLAETVRREQQLAADAQQEFLIQEQRVIVETQKVVLAELREELRALEARQERARAQFETALGRLVLTRAPQGETSVSQGETNAPPEETARAPLEETAAPQAETTRTAQENFSGQA